MTPQFGAQLDSCRQHARDAKHPGARLAEEKAAAIELAREMAREMASMLERILALTHRTVPGSAAG